MTNTMKAVVIHEAGGPGVLKIERRPVPKPEAGQVLIRVKAFGLNRSGNNRGQTTDNCAQSGS